MILFGQTPLNILRDPRITPQAKALYGLLHTYCFEKSLGYNPETKISLKTLAGDMGVSTVTVWKWLKELEKYKWIKIIRRGKKLTNKYRLYGKSTKEMKTEDEFKKRQNTLIRKIARDSELRRRLSNRNK